MASARPGCMPRSPFPCSASLAGDICSCPAYQPPVCTIQHRTEAKTMNKTLVTRIFYRTRLTFLMLCPSIAMGVLPALLRYGASVVPLCDGSTVSWHQRETVVGEYASKGRCDPHLMFILLRLFLERGRTIPLVGSCGCFSLKLIGCRKGLPVPMPWPLPSTLCLQRLRFTMSSCGRAASWECGGRQKGEESKKKNKGPAETNVEPPAFCENL